MNADPRWSRLKILIIDDEPMNVILLEQILRENNYTRLQSVTDSRKAQAAMADFQPDLILLDLMMPHLDGFTLLEEIRAAQNEDTFLPVLVLTADVNEKSKLRALAAGATDFLLKPFDKTEVLLRIRNLLQSRHAHLLLDNQRAAYEEALRERSAELRERPQIGEVVTR